MSWSQSSCGRASLSPESRQTAVPRCPSGAVLSSTACYSQRTSVSNNPYSSAMQFPELCISGATSHNMGPTYVSAPVTSSGPCAYTEHLPITLKAKSTSPNSSLASSGSSSPGSDSSLDLNRAGFRLNLLCHQVTSPTQSFSEENHETSPSCLYAKQKLSTRNHLDDCTPPYAVSNDQHTFSWFNTGSELDFICL